MAILTSRTTSPSLPPSLPPFFLPPSSSHLPAAALAVDDRDEGGGGRRQGLDAIDAWGKEGRKGGGGRVYDEREGTHNASAHMKEQGRVVQRKEGREGGREGGREEGLTDWPLLASPRQTSAE